MKRRLISLTIILITAFLTLGPITSATAAECEWQWVGVESAEDAECYMEWMCVPPTGELVKTPPKTPVHKQHRSSPADDPERCLHRRRCQLA